MSTGGLPAATDVCNKPPWEVCFRDTGVLSFVSLSLALKVLVDLLTSSVEMVLVGMNTMTV